jgi:hypothetical protein
MSVPRLLLAVTATFALLTTVGCQSSGSASAPSAPQRAIVVSGNAGSYTVYVPSADNTHAEMLTSSGAASCPDCKAAAEHYFLTGEVPIPKCPTCGGVRTPVTLVTPTVSHN